MTLEAIYFASQIVAAAAIFGSLVFVGIQIRQNTRQQRAQGNAWRLGAIGEYQWRMTEHEPAALVHKASSLTEPLTDTERTRYFFSILRLIQGFEGLYEMHADGRIGAAQWQQTQHAYRVFMSQPGFRVGYRIYRNLGVASPALEFLDTVLEESHGVEPVDFAAVWNAHAAMELDAIENAKASRGAASGAAPSPGDPT